jgi:hypothetical protein
VDEASAARLITVEAHLLSASVVSVKDLLICYLDGRHASHFLKVLAMWAARTSNDM